MKGYELKDLLQWESSVALGEYAYGIELTMQQAATAMSLAQAELDRRQQPLLARSAASVPGELVEQWHNEWCLAVQSGGMKGVTLFAHIANKAAAYGREQCRAASVPAELSDAQVEAAVDAWFHHKGISVDDFSGRMRAALGAAAYGREQSQQIEGTHD